MASPTDEASRRRGSLLQHRLITQYVMAPVCSSFSPCVLEINLQAGGKILDTWTRLHFSIPASRRASSNECSSSLCVPSPLVKNIFFGTFGFNFSSPSSAYFVI